MMGRNAAASSEQPLAGREGVEMFVPMISIPIAISLVFIVLMFTVPKIEGDFDFGGVLARIGWLIPALATWVIYLTIVLVLNG